MRIKTKRGPSAPKAARLNLYVAPETKEQVERLAELRGINPGAMGRQLLEERIRQLVGSAEAVA